MTISAQRVTEVPETVVTEEVKRTGVMPAPPPLKQDVPILVVVTAPAPTGVETASAAEPAPSKLPKTATKLPLIGLLGAILYGLSLRPWRSENSLYKSLPTQLERHGLCGQEFGVCHDDYPLGPRALIRTKSQC